MYPCKTASLRMNPLQKTFYLNAYTSKLRRIIGPVDRPDRMFGAVACGGMDHSMQVDRLVKHVLYYSFKNVHETPLWVRITLPIFIIKQQLKVASKLAYTLGAKVDLIIGLALFHFPADTIVCLFFGWTNKTHLGFVHWIQGIGRLSFQSVARLDAISSGVWARGILTRLLIQTKNVIRLQLYQKVH